MEIRIAIQQYITMFFKFRLKQRYQTQGKKRKREKEEN